MLAEWLAHCLVSSDLLQNSSRRHSSSVPTKTQRCISLSLLISDSRSGPGTRQACRRELRRPRVSHRLTAAAFPHGSQWVALSPADAVWGHLLGAAGLWIQPLVFSSCLGQFQVGLKVERTQENWRLAWGWWRTTPPFSRKQLFIVRTVKAVAVRACSYARALAGVLLGEKGGVQEVHEIYPRQINSLR